MRVCVCVLGYICAGGLNDLSPNRIANVCVCTARAFNYDQTGLAEAE